MSHNGSHHHLLVHRIDSNSATPSSSSSTVSAPATRSLKVEQRVELVMDHLKRAKDELLAYEFLMGLLSTDRQLFFAAALAHTREILPIVYTPVVGAACTNYHKLILPAHMGLRLSLDDAGCIAQRLSEWPGDVRAIVVTDGERILGLGDLGANGMGIPVGKLALYSALAGVDPSKTLPVTLDCGTENEALLSDPYYCGLARRRERGAAYDDLVEEFVTAVQSRWGKRTLIQFEDFGNSNAFRLTAKYKHRGPSFDDDIEGTASVVLGALVSATSHVQGVPALADARLLFFGAGEAGVGISDLLAYAIAIDKKGPGGSGRAVTDAELNVARSQIWLVDSKGLITADRAKVEGAAFAHHKVPYAHSWPPTVPSTVTQIELFDSAVAAGAPLEAVIAALRPTALIGVAAQHGAFSRGVIDAMTAINARPIVFALSNPTSKSECTAQEALEWSNGAVVFASGSPFDPVTLSDGRTVTPTQGERGPFDSITLSHGRTFTPTQGNNSFIFPPIGLATIAANISLIDTRTMYVAALALAACVDAEEVAATGCLLPPMETIRATSLSIASAVVEDAIARGIADIPPAEMTGVDGEGRAEFDVRNFVAKHVWSPTAAAASSTVQAQRACCCGTTAAASSTMQAKRACCCETTAATHKPFVC